MASQDQVALLRHFKWTEFRAAAHMSSAFLSFLDDVRHEYGWKLVITSDWRSPEANAAVGGSPNSAHLRGEAVDLEYPPTANHVWRLVEAVVRVAGERPVELELVNSVRDQHVHLAFLKPGQASKLLVQAD